jgi:hypothetical protein
MKQDLNPVLERALKFLRYTLAFIQLCAHRYVAYPLLLRHPEQATA